MLQNRLDQLMTKDFSPASPVNLVPAGANRLSYVLRHHGAEPNFTSSTASLTQLCLHWLPPLDLINPERRIDNGHQHFGGNGWEVKNPSSYGDRKEC